MDRRGGWILLRDDEMSASSLSSAVQSVLNQGYQLTPEALRKLQSLLQVEGRKKKGLNSFDSIFSSVLEAKARESLSTGVENRVIGIEDLVRLFPDLPEERTYKEDRNNGKKSIKKESGPLGSSELEVVSDPSLKIKPVGIEGFSELFKNRYEKISKIFMERPEGRRVTKVGKIGKQEGPLRITGLILSKRATKSGIELTVDDDTGRASVFALNEETKDVAMSVALDQCLMLEVDGKGGRLFLKNVVQPDIPNRMVSTSKKTAYAILLSDLHIGSNKFLAGAFDNFLAWLNGKGGRVEGDDEMLERLKYVVIGGDVVDGVGVFPNQEYELEEVDIYKQYAMVAEKLKGIPKHLRLLVIPGNHDSTRQALPQPMIPRKYAGPLYELPNVTMLGDPSVVKLDGVSVLIYHGRSLDDVLATTPGLSYERPTEAMKVLLRARHLAPTFGLRTPIAPEVEDHLVIESVPDIFHSGHVHSVGVEFYKSTLMVNSGTWQAQTGYQANLGIMPRPGLVPIVNLATLEVVFREFLISS